MSRTRKTTSIVLESRRDLHPLVDTGANKRMSAEKQERDELEAGHAAQLDKLLEENALLRQALEGTVDPRLFGATSTSVSLIRRIARRIVPDRFHPAIAAFLKRGNS